MRTIYLFLGGNTEKYTTVTVTTDNGTKRIDKNGEEFAKNICYMLQFIDSARFMASLLSNLVGGNHSEGTHRINFGHDDKKI